MKAMLSVITMHKMSNGFNLLAWKIKNPRERQSQFSGDKKIQREMVKKRYIPMTQIVRLSSADSSYDRY